MVLTFMCAKALVSMLANEDNSDLDSWFPRAYRAKKERFSVPFTSKKKGGAEVPVSSKL
jgi:hypothetical protein